MILPILLPLNIVHGKQSNAGVQGLDRLTWGGVGIDHSSYYWAYLVLTLIVVVQACCTIYGEFQFYVQIRQEHPSSRTGLDTVFISDIPHHLCSQEKLSAIYRKRVGGTYRVWINRDCKMLDRKLKQRDKIVARLEAAETRLISRAIGLYSQRGILGNTDNERESIRLPYSRIAWIAALIPLGKKVDLIYHCRGEIARLNTEILKDQHPARQTRYLHSAFIQFERSIDTHIVYQSAAHFSPFRLSPQYISNFISAII